MTWRTVLSILTVLLVLPVATPHSAAAPRSPKFANEQEPASAVGGAELALVPVGSSAPHVINGNEIAIPAVGGGTVELEIRASGLQDLDAVCVLAYRAWIDSSGYSSGLVGSLDVAQIPCVTDDDCFQESACDEGVCDSRAAAFIDFVRPTALFAGVLLGAEVDLTTPDFAYGATTFAEGCHRPNSGYCGTLILEVPDNAAGTFTIGFRPHPDTAVVDRDDQPILPLALTPALITITAPVCGNSFCELEEDVCSCANDCGSPPSSEVPRATCNDGLDNDCDGSIDSADPDCPAIPAVSDWGIAIMALLLLTLAKVCQRRATGGVTLPVLFLLVAPASVVLAHDESGASAVGGAELALVPVGSSAPHVINGNEIIIPSGGATVELEIRGMGFQKNEEVCISSFVTRIDSSGYTSGLSGTLTPAQIDCVTHEECFGASLCEGGICDLSASAFIDRERPDYLFLPPTFPSVSLVDVSTPDFAYGAVMLLVGACNARDTWYGGTLILDVPTDAKGTFTVAFFAPPDTQVEDFFGRPILPLTLTPALIAVAPPVCGNARCELDENEHNCPLDCAEHGIPAVSQWGLAIMTLLLLTLAKVCQRRATGGVTLPVLFLLVAPASVVLAHDESGASAASGAELALVPVGSSAPHVINGNEIIIPSIGATVELEIRGSGFQKSGETCVSSYLAMIDSSGFTSGGNGALTLAEIPCLTDEDCVGESSCVDTVCDNRSAAFIDAEREDYLFILFPSLRVVDVSIPDFSYSATMVFVGTCNARDSWYGGSLILDVPNNAAGSFTIGFRTHPDTTVNDEFRNPILPLSLTSALITVTPPECGNLICEFDEDERHCPLDCLEHEIPAVGEWGLVIMTLLLLTVAKVCRHCALDRPGRPA